MSRNTPLSVLISVSWIVLALAILAGIVWGNTLISGRIQGETDFLVPWLAGRTYLEVGESPYGDVAARRAQVVHYGRVAGDSEDGLLLWLPFPAELLYLPFSLVRDYALARGIWMTLSVAALVIACFLLLNLIGWKYSRRWHPALVLFTLLCAFPMFTLIGAGPFPITFLAFTAALVALRAGQDELAGVVSVLPFLMLSTFGVVIFFLAWWLLSHRRWRFFAGFGMALGFLLLISFLLMPDWFLPYLRGAYWHILNQPGLTTFRILGDIWPVVGPRLAWIACGILLLILLVEWRNARRKDFNHIIWALCLTFTITPLLGLSINLNSLFLLIPPAFLLVFILEDRWSERKSGGPAAIAAILLWLFSWVVVILGNLRLSAILSFVLLIGLYWMRWWITRPPRTILESMP